MNQSSLLITRPRHDTATSYLHSWTKSVVDEAKTKLNKTIDLEKEKVKRKSVYSYLKKGIVDMVFLNGHGNDNNVYGHDDEMLLSISDRGKVFQGKIFFVRACRCGACFGEHVINNGAAGFVGYKLDFAFWHQSKKDSWFFSNPLKDQEAAPFMNCSNKVASALVKGHPPEVAHKQSIDLYKKTLSEMLVSGKDPFIISALFSNMKNQVCLIKKR